MKIAYQSALLVSTVLTVLTTTFSIWTRDTSLITTMSLWCVTMFFSSQGLYQARKIESLESRLHSQSGPLAHGPKSGTALEPSAKIA